jgi:nucleoside-diphosphate-sugar epimerase
VHRVSVTHAAPTGAFDAATNRIMVIGGGGFIGAAVLAEAGRRGLATLAPRRDDPLDELLEPGDVVVNCALRPEYKSQPYAPAHDIEAASAELAARRDCRVIMLSTRRVYGAAARWGADERAPADGDETIYGANKARTERRIAALLGERACILRVSNAFGFEFARGAAPRRSFLGLMLHRLKHEGEIVFDMHRATRRDFIPVGWVATAVVRAALAGLSGIYNLGGGGPIGCGQLAEAVIAGYGAGVLRAPERVSDEFYLDTRKLTERLGAFGGPGDILETARACGEKLRRE